jgi:hypothetical protein
MFKVGEKLIVTMAHNGEHKLKSGFQVEVVSVNNGKYTVKTRSGKVVSCVPERKLKKVFNW